MAPAAAHPQESGRIDALRRLEILDTAAEAAFDEIVTLAAELVSAPIALISLVDEHRQWFKAKVGVAVDETPRSMAFCAHAILDPEHPLIVEDASRDHRFRDNPLVTEAPNIRFYAGIPLYAPDERLPLGTLCVIDDRPRELRDDQLKALQVFARQIEQLLLLREQALCLTRRNEQLEEATLAKSRFLTTMSHDIRTPMNGILGATELLQDCALPSDAREYVDTIAACGRSLLHLISNVLDLSKIEAGGLELEQAPVDLRQLAESVIAVVSQRARQAGLDLRLQLDPLLPAAVWGDESRLHQIILNLLGNAIKFTTAGSVELALRPDPLTGIVITVTDTGPGLSPEDQRDILQPFTQAGDAAQRRQGTGLGLSIVSGLVEAMQGHLRIDSTLAVGTSFHVFLPLEGATPAESPPMNTDVLGPDLRVLAVDDDQINRSIVKAMLTKLGVETHVAQSGEEALAVDPATVDLVLLDSHMPGIDGVEVARRWRARAQDDRTPIIGLTADAFSDCHRRLRDAGMDEVLSKPISLTVLRDCLLRYTSRIRS